MAQTFKETAHLNTDQKKYAESYEHIFNKEKCQCEECRPKCKDFPDLPERVEVSEFGPCDL